MRDSHSGCFRPPALTRSLVRMLPIAIVLALLGCTPTSYMTVREFAGRIGGRTSGYQTNGTVTVSSSAYCVVLTPGAGMVLINDRPELLRHPVKYEGGLLRVPENIMDLVEGTPDHLPARPDRRGATCRVVIDPGHGGHDSGASYSGLDEKEVNFAIARYVVADLERKGYSVRMTRQSDVFVVLEERTALARRSQADVFVSIHANAARNRSAYGVEVYYPSGTGSRSRTGKRLAEAIYRELGSGSGDRGRGVKSAGFVVLRTSHCPSALVEVGFLSHPMSRSLLGLEGHRRELARAIARGIDNYVTNAK